jgi:predicted Zn-dependent protease
MFACRSVLAGAARQGPRLWQSDFSSVARRCQGWARNDPYSHLLATLNGPSQRFLSSRRSPPSLRREFGRNTSNTQYERAGRSDIPPYVWIGSFGIPLAGLTYLYVHYLDRVPLTRRQRWIATSPEWERQMGDDEYQQLLRQFRGKILPPDHRASITVQRVGGRIYQAAQTFCQDHNVHNQDPSSKKSTISSPPTFTVVQSEMANAFVLPNNHIFVMTGLFKYARNEEELASVLGHEMAHNLARHMGEKVSGNLVVQVLARLSLLVDPSGSLMMVFLPAANLLRELPHSRTQELEADHIGMHLAAQACYDPAAAKRVFQRMKEDSSNQANPPEFLSTHPSHDSRLDQMDDWLPAARRILERGGGDTCRHMQQDIEQARQIAAQRAAERELALRQRMMAREQDPFQ